MAQGALQRQFVVAGQATTTCAFCGSKCPHTIGDTRRSLITFGVTLFRYPSTPYMTCSSCGRITIATDESPLPVRVTSPIDQPLVASPPMTLGSMGATVSAASSTFGAPSALPGVSDSTFSAPLQTNEARPPTSFTDTPNAPASTWSLDAPVAAFDLGPRTAAVPTVLPTPSATTGPGLVTSVKSESKSAVARIVSLVVYVVAIVCIALLIGARFSVPLQHRLFGSSPVTQTIYRDAIVLPTPTWEVGGCVAQSPSGKAFFPIACSAPHFAVIVSKSTTVNACPYYENFNASYKNHATYFKRFGVVWCAVKADIATP